MTRHKEELVFYCVPDDLGAQAQFWEGNSGLLCRPPKGAIQAERARCSRHQREADERAGRGKARSTPKWSDRCQVHWIFGGSETYYMAQFASAAA